jgi:hypothetical protein
VTHGLINLTLTVVMQEIEDVLDQYPEHPYQAAFSMPDLRQKLIDHVQNHVLPHHDVEARQDVASSNPLAHRSSLLQERLRLGMLIRGSMLHLLRQEDGVDAPNYPWHRA